MVNHELSPVERAELLRLAGSTVLLALNLMVSLFALSDGAWTFFGYTVFVSIGMAWGVWVDVGIVQRRHRD